MVAIVFPGQGSQKPGMGQDLHQNFASARSAFETVSQATGVNVSRLCFESDEDTLRQTQNAQIALYTCGVAAWSVLHEEAGDSFPIGGMAGHSVGEYAALAAAGVLTIPDGAKLVQRRGDLMARSGNLRAGGMAAVLGLERRELEQVCSAVSSPESVVVVANDNCPGQLVISGDKAAVEAAGLKATEAGAKRVLPLNVSGAFHSPLMLEPSQSMAEALRQVAFAKGAHPVYSNVTARPVEDPTEWSRLLEEQLRNPVRWTETVEALVASGVHTFVECGAGEVLGGLVRRTTKEAQSFAVFDSESLKKTLDALAEIEVRA